MRQFRSIMIISALMAAMPSALSVSYAQESIPALTLDAQSLRSGGGGFVQEERPTFTYQNPYLNETLILQYQNILLEKMVQRQNVIARTEKSFMEVGLPFHQPPPPRGICEQLPVNVPCYKAYPDLFPGAVPEIEQIDQQLTAVLLGAAGRGSSEQAAMARAPEPPPEPEINLGAYRWAEITCAGGQCMAVVAKDGARRTVRAGDTLDNGIKVTRITATGVEVSKGDKTESLQAALAPSRGGAASPKYAAGFTVPSGSTPNLSGSLSQQSQQLEEFFTKNDAKGSAAEVGSVPPPAPLPVGGAPVDPGPPLGPTGLF